jgi:hypothetical protein
MADQVLDESAQAEPPALEEALAWSGWKLDGYSGASVGRVEGVLTDAETGEPTWLVVRMGRFGHFSGVPFALAAAGVGRVWVPYERELIRQAPRLEPGSPLTREQELEMCTYFQVPPDHERAAELSGRTEGAQTSVPASS